ncbi:avidin family protein [Variovorax paradoxus B4]|uniref:Avidin family protein n=1 Tax=Variovorax paradoxus B4 TaxID=1246301 RepID=T1XLQ0_VARPD|nr:avidin family protein [Variovorax paradoxus]AGU53050.1 avidin family protein [Variovorax paradoxus B4]
MRLERVLAQWAGGAMADNPQSPQGLVTGRWTNEYGSVADIAVDGDRVLGTYTSAVGDDAGVLSGPISGFVRADIVAFAVLWPAHMRSITSWVGQVVDNDGVPELKTLWHLIVDLPDADEAAGLWTTVHTGADVFRQAIDRTPGSDA